MRKIIVLSFISLDGIMQAPGGPEEDTSGGFKYGGWTFPYFDEAAGRVMERQMQPTDYLFGRKTFDIFESYWQKPEHVSDWPGVNTGMKYVMSTTRDSSDWQNTTFIRTVDEIKELKNSDGPDLQVHGSGEMIQTLLTNDLVDELWLKTFPVTLGSGKKLFASGTIPAAFELAEHTVTPTGVIFATYIRDGEVKTGSF